MYVCVGVCGGWGVCVCVIFQNFGKQAFKLTDTITMFYPSHFGNVVLVFILPELWILS